MTDPTKFELEMEMDAPMTTPRKRKRVEPLPRGHAALSGTGPEGETCGSCANLFRNRMPKTYLKCGLMEAYWTGGRATDVRARDPACRRWEKKQPEIGKET